ncbi:MAG TPA: hypothetical protein VF698_11605 [Thermoanaerobaculia bacterium]
MVGVPDEVILDIAAVARRTQHVPRELREILETGSPFLLRQALPCYLELMV